MLEIDANTTAQEAIDRLGAGNIRSVELRSNGSGTQGVLVPVERYLQLVATDLLSNPRFEVRANGGGIEPAGLASADVEQVDKDASWRNSY